MLCFPPQLPSIWGWGNFLTSSFPNLLWVRETPKTTRCEPSEELVNAAHRVVHTEARHPRWDTVEPHIVRALPALDSVYFCRGSCSATHLGTTKQTCNSKTKRTKRKLYVFFRYVKANKNRVFVKGLRVLLFLATRACLHLG